MNQRFFDTEQEIERITDVRSEQIRMLYASIPTSLITILVNSSILAGVLWTAIDHSVIIAWLLSTNLLSLIRLFDYQQFNLVEHDSILDKSWYRRVVIMSIASGLTWAAGGLLLFDPHNLVNQLFLVFVIAGMCAGAVTTLAAILVGAQAFLVITLVPMFFQLVFAHHSFSLAMSTMTLLFMVMLLVSAKRINQTIIESLTLRYQHEMAERKIRYQAMYDDLTDLPNRRMLLKTLHQEIAKADRHNRFGALLFVDIDRFKAVNDSLGHSFGDELLVKVSDQIQTRLRKEDVAARIGGDEFIILLPEVGHDADGAGSHATAIANQLRSLFTEPLLIQDQKIHLTLSIGIALFPAEGGAEDLLKHADVAMYETKKSGRDGVSLFSPDMQETVNQYRIIEKGLREALQNNELILYFQSQHDVDEQIIGAETLLRWNHPQKGIVAPGLFVDIAERSGLIVPIGEWVLRSACEHLTKIEAGSNFRLSVNVSPRQFGDRNFIDKLKQVLLETGADPKRLRLEITEGLAIDNIDNTIDTMDELKRLGITFSIDDFGTGYSSLSYLNRLPVDELKIDQSFVKNITQMPENAVIVDTILFMAKNLNLEIIAEGVESASELDYLKQRGCLAFQGYYFTKPEPFESFILKTGK